MEAEPCCSLTSNPAAGGLLAARTHCRADPRNAARQRKCYLPFSSSSVSSCLRVSPTDWMCKISTRKVFGNLNHLKPLPTDLPKQTWQFFCLQVSRSPFWGREAAIPPTPTDTGLPDPRYCFLPAASTGQLCLMKAGEAMAMVNFLFHTPEFGQKTLKLKANLNFKNKWVNCAKKSMKRDIVLIKN